MNRKQAEKEARRIRKEFGCAVAICEKVWAYTDGDITTTVEIYIANTPPGVPHFTERPTLQEALDALGGAL